MRKTVLEDRKTKDVYARLIWTRETYQNDINCTKKSEVVLEDCFTSDFYPEEYFFNQYIVVAIDFYNKKKLKIVNDPSDDEERYAVSRRKHSSRVFDCNKL